MLDPARKMMDSGLPLYDAEPSKLADLSAEPKYVMTIGVATVANCQGYKDHIRNSELDAAYRTDQAKCAETQFAYVQTTTLADRRHPQRIKLMDVPVETTEEMRGNNYNFQSPDNQSENKSQYGMPEMGEIDMRTDLQRFVVKMVEELNYKGRNYHPNKRALIQKNGKFINIKTERYLIVNK